ncbi:SDR family oxidoreductase [Mycolicibacterium goodii]|uniref:SDR family oxidoreductase n=1 Tax=Mycolicibacterium goodii TaxID=134601 RepID=A0ABS6HJZ2_MYCGD|nr:SDR family oxidoreductase [Mycolicibacterium goodii]MBU8839779.1 SDR family oxidoreductase [Mycolicibacterium goodii]
MRSQSDRIAAGATCNDNGSVQKVVIITGAGSGIGQATAQVLLDAGHHVVLAGRRADPLRDTARGRPNARVVPTDVADPASVRALFADAVTAFGRVDVLFNNAGLFGPAASVAEIDDEQWQRTWRTNVDGAVFCAREAARVMAEQLPRGGRIINNGSLSAHRPRPKSLAYTVTKHAISGLTASMLLDLRSVDICVTQIDIGNAATTMTAGFSHQTLQANGALAAEPTFDVVHVARAVAHLVDLPLEVAVPSLTVMAREMPFYGRG